MSDGSSLTNHLLVAMPSLTDPEFVQAVALVCEHSLEKGALGIIINKPLPMTLTEIFVQMNLEAADVAIGARSVLRGGPVHRDRGFVVHRAEGQWDSSHEVSESIRITTSRDVLAAMARGEGPADAFIALGYAGWEAGQLEQELRDNAWITLPVDEQILFRMPFEDRWHAVWRQLGVDVGRLSHVAGHA
jgi:putative transcriptional regulator